MQFPTQAEQAINEWKQKSFTETLSFSIIAKAHNALREQDGGTTEWIFDDDSKVVITGRGRSHRIFSDLP